jgi:hypothetical protein
VFGAGPERYGEAIAALKRAGAQPAERIDG